LRLRSLLGLEQDQEINILTLNNPTPQSTQTSLVSEIRTMNSSELFYNSPNGSSLIIPTRRDSTSSVISLFSQETKPNHLTVEEYHAYINKPLPQLPLLGVGQEVFPRHFDVHQLRNIRGDV
jgi:hypothetical protein